MKDVELGRVTVAVYATLEEPDAPFAFTLSGKTLFAVHDEPTFSESGFAKKPMFVGVRVCACEKLLPLAFIVNVYAKFEAP